MHVSVSAAAKLYARPHSIPFHVGRERKLEIESSFAKNSWHLAPNTARPQKSKSLPNRSSLLAAVRLDWQPQTCCAVKVTTAQSPSSARTTPLHVTGPIYRKIFLPERHRKIGFLC